jgi:hypothetical protein
MKRNALLSHPRRYGCFLKTRAILQSTVAATLIFLLVDAALEGLIDAVFGLSVLGAFEEHGSRTYGSGFHMVNLALFAGEMGLVMVFFALIRPRFASLWKPVAVTTVFFLVLIGLFVGQMVNLGIYPLEAAVAMLATSSVAFPAAVVGGTLAYSWGR